MFGCASIASLAESLAIDLAIPAFSLVEPYEVWRRRKGERTELYKRLTLEMGQLARTEPYAETVEDLADPASILVRSGNEDKRRLNLDSRLRRSDPSPGRNLSGTPSGSRDPSAFAQKIRLCMPQ